METSYTYFLCKRSTISLSRKQMAEKWLSENIEERLFSSSILQPSADSHHNLSDLKNSGIPILMMILSLSVFRAINLRVKNQRLIVLWKVHVNSILVSHFPSWQRSMSMDQQLIRSMYISKRNSEDSFRALSSGILPNFSSIEKETWWNDMRQRQNQNLSEKI